MDDPLRTLLDAAVALCEAGRPVSLDLTLGGWHITLHSRPAEQGEAEAPIRPARAPEPVKGCGADLLTVLRESGVRMTGPEILAELAERRMEHSERNVTRWLGLLKQAGLVNHDPQAHPPGYGAVRQ